MKKCLWLTILIGASCFSLDAQRIEVTVTNPLKLNRPGEIVVLQWKDLLAKQPALKQGTVAALDNERNVVSQLIDLDGDSVADELLFQSDFGPKETKYFTVATLKQMPVQSLTDARFMKPREDMAWENDRIAYRMYGPALAKEVDNGIDVWTKRVRHLIVEKWYKGDEKQGAERVSYHEDHGEGADYFAVGRTLGCGSCALYKEDSLYQPGVFVSHKVIATGPLRAIFEVSYNPVVFGGKKIVETKRISLDAGVNLNRVEVTYTGEGKSELTFAAGIVKRNDVITFTDKNNGCVGLWGLTTDKEDIGSLGTGIFMPKKTFKEIRENEMHVLIIGSAKVGIPTTYYSGAGWTRSGDFSTADDWNKYMKEFAQKKNAPLKIKIGGKK
jgi:pectinesterase